METATGFARIAVRAPDRNHAFQPYADVDYEECAVCEFSVLHGRHRSTADAGLGVIYDRAVAAVPLDVETGLVARWLGTPATFAQALRGHLMRRKTLS